MTAWSIVPRDDMITTHHISLGTDASSARTSGATGLVDKEEEGSMWDGALEKAGVGLDLVPRGRSCLGTEEPLSAWPPASLARKF